MSKTEIAFIGRVHFILKDREKQMIRNKIYVYGRKLYYNIIFEQAMLYFIIVNTIQGPTI